MPTALRGHESAVTTTFHAHPKRWAWHPALKLRVDAALAMIITIDGPAGSGKSSAAQALAERLGFEFLDTGAMYRAVALAILRSGIDESNTVELQQVLAACRLEVPRGRVLLNGEDVSGLIRTPEVSA